MKKDFNNKEIKLFSKLMNFCTKRERCENDVEKKAFELGLNTNETERLMHHLKQENFIDDKRYTETFVHSRFYNKSWGKIKIRNELKSKYIKEDIIDKALEEIPEKDYKNTFLRLFNKKYNEVKNKNNTKQKIFNNLAQKGFEKELIMEKINDL